MKIFPTHTCFDDAMEFLELHLAESPLLMHGVCMAPTGEHYAHAWVELGEVCWDCGIANGEKGYFQRSVRDHYEHRVVVEVTKYTLREAAFWNLATGNFGPWNPKYRKLCSSSKRVYGET